MQHSRKYVPETHPSYPIRNKTNGFTLIELMVVVAIIGVLLAVALPAYKDYVVRGAITDAITGLTNTRADMERYYQDFRTYQAVGTTASPPCTAAGTTVGKFNITCTTAASTYTLTATGIASSPVTSVVYTVDQAENKATIFSAALIKSGWTSCSTKWVTRKGDAC
ncbi:type IV pilus assembly protein PilE [Roseateles sp. YR242]|uniref:type IV pilin protein n=1 Tax=Roseateles sp. YR242 TaxID=1855305 RepID=UPI0008B2FF47|nr:type IV pilin protein [Roseateles sp. YR242]SEL27011.1 type IV pilus assembly protein PilE [Roseateles sp. YR242]